MNYLYKSYTMTERSEHLIAMSDALQDIDHKMFRKYTLPDIFPAKVLSIYDGDTLTFGMQLNNEYVRFNGRLFGIDTPEKRISKKDPFREYESNYAKLVLKFLETKILGQIIIIKFCGWDKYGRPLIDVYKFDNTAVDCCGDSVSRWLINNEFAFVYDGKTKRKWGPYLGGNNASEYNRLMNRH